MYCLRTNKGHTSSGLLINIVIGPGIIFPRERRQLSHLSRSTNVSVNSPCLLFGSYSSSFKLLKLVRLTCNTRVFLFLKISPIHWESIEKAYIENSNLSHPNNTMIKNVYIFLGYRKRYRLDTKETSMQILAKGRNALLKISGSFLLQMLFNKTNKYSFHWKFLR